MKPLAALGLTLLAANGRAATAYVTDELILGVYAEQNGQGQRLTTLHSGAVVETLSAVGDYTQVRLADGVLGWVKSAYVTTNEPAIVRLKQVQDELDRSRATTPGLAEAAARSEVERLKRELAALQGASAADQPAGDAPGMIAAGNGTASSGAAGNGTASSGAAGNGTAGSGARTSTTVSGGAGRTAAARGFGGAPWMSGLAVIGALIAGFCVGYTTLARRVKQRFGGIKVY